jgi:hypothetical protein
VGQGFDSLFRFGEVAQLDRATESQCGLEIRICLKSRMEVHRFGKNGDAN